MGAVTMTGNPETSVPQQYDTLAPIITGGDTATAMFIVNDPVTTEVYNADATDGGTADTGITYSLGGADAGQFNINPATGSVTYINSPSVAADHTIVITATDKGGNTDTITVTITVTITAAFSDNSDLSALTVTTTGGAAVPLSPAFATATSAYTASVRQEVTSVTITLPTAHTGATAVITGTAADGTALTVTDSTISGSTATRTTISGLTEGISPNTITITVTAADRATMTVYTITLIRAPLLTFGTAADGTAITIADQTYDIGEAIPTLTLPEATGGLGTLSYTLTPTADIPAGLTFAPATRSLSGTPTATESRTLTYTVTDAANPPVTTELTFNVLTRAPLLTFGTAADGTAITIADQTYDIGEAIPILTLPEATGGLGTLSYTLTPTDDIPAGLTFAPATRSLSGTPTALETRTLTYTVTDAATPPVTTELTFNVNIVRRTMVKASDTTIALDLDEDGDKTTTDPGNAILTLPSGHSVTEATLNTPPETATNNPPAGVAFSLTTDITLDATLAAAATICLPTTGVPAGREPVLYHYFTRAGQGAATWNEISRDTATREGYICGETLTFSPFAVGYMTGVMGAARLNEQILPRASLVMSASMLAAVAARVEAAADSTGGGGIGAGIGSIEWVAPVAPMVIASAPRRRWHINSAASHLCTGCLNRMARRCWKARWSMNGCWMVRPSSCHYRPPGTLPPTTPATPTVAPVQSFSGVTATTTPSATTRTVSIGVVRYSAPTSVWMGGSTNTCSPAWHCRGIAPALTTTMRPMAPTPTASISTAMSPLIRTSAGCRSRASNYGGRSVMGGARYTLTRMVVMSIPATPRSHR